MIVQRGQIFLLLESDESKARPVVVVSRDDLSHGDSVLCVPFYSQQLEKRKQFKTCVLFKAGQFGLSKDCVAKGDEITVIDKTMLNLSHGQIGRLNAESMAKIVRAVRFAIRCDDLEAPRT